jgi:hypothetical protein
VPTRNHGVIGAATAMSLDLHKRDSDTMLPSCLLLQEESLESSFARREIASCTIFPAMFRQRHIVRYSVWELCDCSEFVSEGVEQVWRSSPERVPDKLFRLWNVFGES